MSVIRSHANNTFISQVYHNIPIVVNIFACKCCNGCQLPAEDAVKKIPPLPTEITFHRFSKIVLSEAELLINCSIKEFRDHRNHSSLIASYQSRALNDAVKITQDRILYFDQY